MLRDRTAFAGSLRNASAVAAAAQDAAAESIRKRIAVIAAGEHWPGGNLRPAIEDLLGAGAIIERLQGRPSPEARAARAAYQSEERRVGKGWVRTCRSRWSPDQ